MKLTQVYIITGAQGEGKSTRCTEIIRKLKSNGESVGGIIAPGFWENNARYRFDLMDVKTEQRMPFAQREAKAGWKKIKTFYFNPEAIKKGEAILHAAVQENEWIVLDELGKLDLHGEVWGPVFTDLIHKHHKKWIISIRDLFVNEAIVHWNLPNVKTLRLSDEFTF